MAYWGLCWLLRGSLFTGVDGPRLLLPSHPPSLRMPLPCSCFVSCFTEDLLRQRPTDVRQFMVGWAAMSLAETADAAGDNLTSSADMAAAVMWDQAAEQILKQAVSYVRASLARRLDEGLLQPASHPTVFYPPSYCPEVKLEAFEEFLRGLCGPGGCTEPFDAQVIQSLITGYARVVPYV